MQLEEQAAGVAKDGAIFITPPKWCGACRAVLANGLQWVGSNVSKCSHEVTV